MKTLRKRRLRELLNGKRFKGDRAAFLMESGITKGRLSQLLDPEVQFGDAASLKLARRLGLPDDYFDEFPVYDEYTEQAIALMISLDESQRIGALAVLANHVKEVESLMTRKVPPPKESQPWHDHPKATGTLGHAS